MNTLFRKHGRPVGLWMAFMALMALMAFLVATLGLTFWLALQGVKAKPGEWSHTLRLGPWQHSVSVPAMLRLGLHPYTVAWLNGREFNTQAGRWRIESLRHGSLRATCSPCTLKLAALGPQPLTVPTATVLVHRAEPEAWRGMVVLSAGRNTPEALSSIAIRWHAKLASDAVQLKLSMPDTEIAAWVALWSAAMPREAHARVEGKMAFELTTQLSALGWGEMRLKPRVHDAAVWGLGTEALLDVDLAAGCATKATRLQGWLPHAVIAAEDQRFYEHAGFDLVEALQAWQSNQGAVQDGANDGHPTRSLRGASTLTQQLAKLLYTGDDRSAVRKLREWLYAVEMERTLGKAQILQLYLAVAPWGDGACGAREAARRHLGREADALQPHEAAWLASLLRRPNAELAKARRVQRIDTVATQRVIDGMRRLPRERREAAAEKLATWRPSAIKSATKSTAHHAPTDHMPAP
jgi:hypothetical protein